LIGPGSVSRAVNRLRRRSIEMRRTGSRILLLVAAMREFMAGRQASTRLGAFDGRRR
jgi:hypothetical protein